MGGRKAKLSDFRNLSGNGSMEIGYLPTGEQKYLRAEVIGLPLTIGQTPSHNTLSGD